MLHWLPRYIHQKDKNWIHPENSHYRQDIFSSRFLLDPFPFFGGSMHLLKVNLTTRLATIFMENSSPYKINGFRLKVTWLKTCFSCFNNKYWATLRKDQKN